jgi:hypothetical protein
MLRPLYRFVLRLHPPAFRLRFADEMLSIFDATAGGPAHCRLLLDGILSLTRQWGLRPEFWHEHPVPKQQSAPDGIPSFLSLDPFRPRTAAVIHALVLSTVVFCLTCFAIRYSWIHVLHVRIPEVQWESPRPMHANSAPTGRQKTDQLEETGAAVRSQGQSSVALPGTPGTQFKAPSGRANAAMASRKAVAGPSEPPGTPIRGTPSPGSEEQGALVLTPQASTSTTPAPPPQAYAGTYVSLPPNRVTITIIDDGGRLTMEIGGERKGTLSPLSATKFAAKGVRNCSIEFAPDSDGTIRQLKLLCNDREITAQRR